MTPAEVGELIRETRKSRGWSQAELSRRLGTAQTNVCSWEKGNGYPSESYLAKLNPLLGLDIPVHGGITAPTCPGCSIKNCLNCTLPDCHNGCGVTPEETEVLNTWHDERRGRWKRKSSHAPFKKGMI